LLGARRLREKCILGRGRLTRLSDGGVCAHEHNRPRTRTRQLAGDRWMKRCGHTNLTPPQPGRLLTMMSTTLPSLSLLETSADGGGVMSNNRALSSLDSLHTCIGVKPSASLPDVSSTSLGVLGGAPLSPPAPVAGSFLDCAQTLFGRVSGG
jgi:hypothetical protein